MFRAAFIDLFPIIEPLRREFAHSARVTDGESLAFVVLDLCCNKERGNTDKQILLLCRTKLDLSVYSYDKYFAR